MPTIRFPLPENPGPPFLRCQAVLAGDQLDTADLYGRIPVEGAEVTSRGTVQGPSLPPYPETSWSVETAIRSSLLDEGVERLLDILEPYRVVFSTAAKQPDVSSHLSVSVHLTKDPCHLELSPKTLQRLAAFEVPFLVEVYDYRQEAPQDS